MECMEYKKLDKKAEMCMRINEIIWTAIMLVVILTLDYFFLYDFSKTAGLIAAAVLIILAVTAVIAVPKMRCERYKYVVNDEVIRVRAGLIWISETIIPMERLHKIEVSQGPVDRMFGLASIKVTTAGGDGTIKFLSEEETSQLAERLKSKINEIAREERSK